MKAYFEDLKETIERGRANDMPREAHLMLHGQVLYAAVRGDLTKEEVDRLEALLNLPDDSFRLEEFALFGHDDEYQRDFAA
jgi:hypothetical protein